jgi:hypothetical protein
LKKLNYKKIKNTEKGRPFHISPLILFINNFNGILNRKKCKVKCQQKDKNSHQKISRKQKYLYKFEK